MVWDLRGALLKKQEVESARLADFEFRLRARTMRLLAPLVGMSPDDLVPRIALEDDEAILNGLSGGKAVHAVYERCRAAARSELIAELGDPSPHRLA